MIQIKALFTCSGSACLIYRVVLANYLHLIRDPTGPLRPMHCAVAGLTAAISKTNRARTAGLFRPTGLEPRTRSRWSL